jgi:2-alkyl-3-oxoalkanoate reductase
MGEETTGTRSLVTGAAGFVGSHVADALLERGDQVMATDVAPTGHRSDMDYTQMDITDADAVRASVQGMDAVFHVASIVHTKRNNSARVFEVNHGGTKSLLKACQEAGVKRFIYMSSASVVYEGKDIENGDEGLPYGKGQAPYADSKIEAEKDVHKANTDRFRTCAIRPHIVFGKGDTRFLPNILSRAKSGKLKMGVGGQSRLSDFTYIDNLIQGVLLADASLISNGKAAGQAYFITNGEPIPFWQFVDKFLEALDYPTIKGYVPYGVAYVAAALAEFVDTLKGGGINPENGLSRFAVRYMCTHHYFSIDKAKRDLGYDPKVSIDEGVRRTVADLK